MSKTSTDLVRHALNGPTMGTRWTAVLYAPRGLLINEVRDALQQSVDEVDQQMSTWHENSDLMRLNRLPVGASMAIPAHLQHVLKLALPIGQASGGAFDIGVGEAVTAWGFGPQAVNPARIRSVMRAHRHPVREALELRSGLVHKRHEATLDLNGIAKGYGVDRLAQVLLSSGIENGLVGIDGEMRALGRKPDNDGWTIAIEAPDPTIRTTQAVLSLVDAAVATSGDYRHWIQVGPRRISHTMEPSRGAPLESSPASVTVVAQSCAEADAWATALMVLGPEPGLAVAEKQGLNALFLMRESTGEIVSFACGSLFARPVQPVQPPRDERR